MLVNIQTLRWAESELKPLKSFAYIKH